MWSIEQGVLWNIEMKVSARRNCFIFQKQDIFLG
jgi:hypothetical protein